MLGIRWIAWLIIATGLAACTTSGGGAPSAGAGGGTGGAYADAARPQGASAAAVAALASTASPGAQGADYRLSPLDVLEVSVFQVPDLNRTVQINNSGNIALPLIGTVRAGGRTVGELETEVTRLYGARYLQSPQISIFVKEFTSQRVTVDGAVNQPGVYPLTGRATLLQAISMAKGVERTGDETGVMVFRMVDGTRQGAVFNLREIRAGRATDPVLEGGDTVVVDHSAVLTAWRGVRESIGVLSVFRPIWLP